MYKIAFLDRDGVINKNNIQNGYIGKIENFKLISGAIKAIKYLKKLNYNYIKDARVGDHIWYISDLSKFKNDYPQWKIPYNIERIIKEIYNDNLSRFK